MRRFPGRPVEWFMRGKPDAGLTGAPPNTPRNDHGESVKHPPLAAREAGGCDRQRRAAVRRACPPWRSCFQSL